MNSLFSYPRLLSLLLEYLLYLYLHPSHPPSTNSQQFPKLQTFDTHFYKQTKATFQGLIPYYCNVYTAESFNMDKTMLWIFRVSYLLKMCLTKVSSDYVMTKCISDFWQIAWSFLEAYIVIRTNSTVCKALLV